MKAAHDAAHDAAHAQQKHSTTCTDANERVVCIHCLQPAAPAPHPESSVYIVYNLQRQHHTQRLHRHDNLFL